MNHVFVDLHLRRLVSGLWLLTFVFAACNEVDSSSSTDMNDDLSAQLEILGYVNSVPVRAETAQLSGVTLHNEALADAGLNLSNPRHTRAASLLTMQGESIHTWAFENVDGASDRYQALLPRFQANTLEGWQHVELASNGDLFVIAAHHMLLRLDWDSKLVWKRDIAAHHDLSLGRGDRVLVIIDEMRRVETSAGPVSFLDAVIVELSAAGVEVERWSIFDALMSDPVRKEEIAERLVALVEPQSRWNRVAGRLKRVVLAPFSARARRESLIRDVVSGEEIGDPILVAALFNGRDEDVLHANSVQVLPADVPGLWSAGDLLVCVRNLDLLVTISRETGRLLWAWGDTDLQGPHHATFLPSGKILVFDNGVRRGHSRVVKVEPASENIVWEYEATPKESFFTSTRGGVQQLGNGNLLVTQTNAGRSFEITNQGRTVWEYYERLLDDPNSSKRKRAANYRMTRVDQEIAHSMLQ